jgi:hypothetical protein
VTGDQFGGEELDEEEYDEYDDLEFDKYLHSARWWDSVYADKDDPALVGLVLPLQCAFSATRYAMSATTRCI